MGHLASVSFPLTVNLQDLTFTTQNPDKNNQLSTPIKRTMVPLVINLRTKGGKCTIVDMEMDIGEVAGAIVLSLGTGISCTSEYQISNDA